MPFRDAAGQVIKPPARNTAQAKSPETLGLRVILAPIEGVTASGLFHGPFLFQAPPLDEFQEQMAFNHGDFMTAFTGERSRPMGRQLETIDFSTLWMDDGSRDHAPSWALVKKAIDPIAAKLKLKAILYSGSPFWLMVHQMPVWHKYDVRMMVTMRSLTSLEKGGETDARYFSMQVREFRPTDVLTKGAGKPRNRVGPKGTHVTVANLPANRDTLYELAKYYYGSAKQWQSIAKANGMTGVSGSQNLKTLPKAKARAKLFLPPAKVPHPSKPAKPHKGRH